MDDQDLSEEAKVLIQGYVEGTLTSAECRRLRELIRRTPSLARLIADSVRMDGEIREITPVRIRRTSRRLRSRYRPADRPSGAWVATAAGILILLTMAVQDDRRPRKTPSPDQGIVKIVPMPAPKREEPKQAPPDPPSGVVQPPAELHPLSARPPSAPKSENGPADSTSPAPAPVGPSKSGMTVVETPTPVARVEGAKGAFVTSGKAEKEIVGTYDLLPGEALRTEQKGRATLVYSDGTRVTLEPETKVSGATTLNGKVLHVDKGAISAVVSKQKDGEPMVIGTSNATAKILGTTLRVAVESDLTRLQVLEGSVGLVNKAGALAEVTGGQEAKAGRTDKSILPRSMNGATIQKAFGIVISFGPPQRSLPPGVVVDSGAKFDPQRGYGWERVLGNGPLIGVAERLKGSFVAGGTASTTGTWRMPMANGKYVVRACVGGAPQGVADQGPHHVTVEGKVIIDTKMTLHGEFHIGEGTVDVIDGELTVVIGGHRSDKKTPTDNDDDTILNFITIRRVRD